MKRKGLRKCELKHVKVMPSAIFQDRSSSGDIDWLVGRMNEDGLPISIPTGHGITLKDDHIHEYKDSSNGPGYLILTVQIYISGDRAWTVPVVGKPGSPGSL